MKKVLAFLLTAVAAIFSTAATTGCALALLDEPEMPESLQ